MTSCLLTTYLWGFHQLLAVLLLGLLQPAVCLEHTQKAARLAQMKNVYRHFATDPSAWHLIRMPIAERLGPAPAPTPFCGSQKTARACLWSGANYSSLKRGEKLYLCCQLLEKHKDFYRLKKKKCVWQEKEATHTGVYQGHFVSERTEERQGESSRHRLPGSSTAWGTQLQISAWRLPFVPAHVPSHLKVAMTLRIDPTRSWTS